MIFFCVYVHVCVGVGSVLTLSALHWGAKEIKGEFSLSGEGGRGKGKWRKEGRFEEQPLSFFPPHIPAWMSKPFEGKLYFCATEPCLVSTSQRLEGLDPNDLFMGLGPCCWGFFVFMFFCLFVK